MNEAVPADRIVALSVSKSPDLARLGYPEGEISRLLGKLCTEFVVQGARVLYGGDLRQDGYTLHLFKYVAQAYRAGKTPAPFINFLPFYALAETSPEDLRRHLQANALASETWVAPRGGDAIDLRADDDRFLLTPLTTREPRYMDVAEFSAWLGALPKEDRPEQLTHMREVSSRLTFARVVVGGKTGDARVEGDAYVGIMPGIVEETILTLEAGRIPVVLGAYGGAALDLAIAMELLPNSAALQRGTQNASYTPAVTRAAQLWRTHQARAHFAQLTDFAGRDDTDTLARDVARFIASAG